MPQQRSVTAAAYPNEKVQTNKRLTSDELADVLGDYAILLGLKYIFLKVTGVTYYYFVGDESLRKKQKVIHQKNNGNFKIATLNKTVPENKTLSHNEPQSTKLKKNISQKQEYLVQDIKIKTLAEIRAERTARRGGFPDDKMITSEQDEAEVSSTSTDENIQNISHNDSDKSLTSGGTKKKIKLRRKLNLNEENISTNDRDENVVTSNELPFKDYEETFSSDQNEVLEEYSEESKYSSKLIRDYTSDSDKMEEDVLLLEDDEEEYEDVNLKGEDELLKEISSFIDN